MYSKLLLVYALVVVVLCGTTHGEKKCKPILNYMCKFLSQKGYGITNMTKDAYRASIGRIEEFLPLFHLKCANEISPFICANYLTLCKNDRIKTIRPCRSLCEKSRAGCEPLMRKYSFRWPFACSQYPSESDGECFKFSDVNNESSFKPENKTQKKHQVEGQISGTVGSTLIMECAEGYVVDVQNVTHSNSECCDKLSKGILTNFCHNKSTCKFQNSESTFGAHCKGKIGTVKVEYKCKKTSNKKKSC
ncbi:frizzled-5-like [Hydractinia symbiolongicarpus]|uniref:frizzled-5-like n=1 Tax=Hydractinia symbiolongicarpus TaxID=13093 RepID=UPI00254F98D7|nr:frizzled-5-like [Hydractinia symbiolongicarpus]